MLIAHVIVGLNKSGAELSLYKICRYASSHQHVVISLTDKGFFGKPLEDLDVRVVALGLTKRSWAFGFVRLRTLLREIGPDIVHGWMPHGILLSSLAARSLNLRRLFWGIRASDYLPGLLGSATAVLVRLLAMMSWTYPRKILCVGERALEAHASLGFRRSKMIVLRNGFQAPKIVPELYGPNQSTPHVTDLSGRKTPVVGMIARYHPQKDHATLLHAMKIVIDGGNDCTLILAGSGLTPENQNLRKLIRKFDLSQNVKLLGELESVNHLYPMMTVHILSSSFGEGMPNSVAESMLFAVPNIVTNVGDSSHMVGNTGWVVEPGSPEKLAEAISDALSRPPEQIRKLGQKAAQRILNEFSLTRMIKEVDQAYRENFVTAFTRYGSSGASSRVRVEQFVGGLLNLGWKVKLSPLLTEELLDKRSSGATSRAAIFIRYVSRIHELRAAKAADIIWIEKELFPFLPAWLENLLLGRSRRVFDFDDAVYLSYSEHPSPMVRWLLAKKHEKLVKRSDWVNVGNANLARHFRSHAEARLSIIPSTCEARVPEQARSDGGVSRPFRFGWIGSPTTYQDYLAPRMELFDRIAAGLEAEFLVMGSGVDGLGFINSRFIPWALAGESEFFSSIDVGLMPLENDQWSRGKCGYKLVQYMAHGLPVLASSVGVNSEIVGDGENGYLISDDSEWHLRLDQFKNDRKQALLMGLVGWQKHHRLFNPKECVKLNAESFANALRLPRHSAAPFQLLPKSSEESEWL